MNLNSDMVYEAVSKGIWSEEYKALFGHFNDAPPNWRQIEQDEFWRWFSTYGFGIGNSFKQITRKGEAALGVHLIHYHDGTGFGIHVDWQYGKEPEWVPEFYRFAVCEHARIGTLDTPYGWHEGHCGKCGIQMNYDSSG